ncbi:Acyl-CoA-binding domain-containing protein 1 [Platanthera guangdongensis]|uniref:Acyl-CoA-binding domain-containing protein 1 n=1 Tax=Platanthera guangdongensis TaxID=2320717 RepID=A0ABR2LNU8_9ASPA
MFPVLPRLLLPPLLLTVHRLRYPMTSNCSSTVFYKISTEGPCTVPQPSALNCCSCSVECLAKTGAMPPEEAMQKYIEIVEELFPSWSSGSNMARLQFLDHI